MRKLFTLPSSLLLLASLALLGAGCRPQPPASSVNSTAQPTVNATPSPASDPLADDLDAAIEDLEAIE
ncbi:MAG: hypothetical protein Q8R16_01745 [bacterium]|nr:hypothetical protein [bacterium]